MYVGIFNRQEISKEFKNWLNTLYEAQLDEEFLTVEDGLEFFKSLVSN